MIRLLYNDKGEKEIIYALSNLFSFRVKAYKIRVSPQQVEHAMNIWTADISWHLYHTQHHVSLYVACSVGPS